MRLAALIPILVVLAWPAGAAAKQVRCVPGDETGPLCHVWKGKVVSVNDGDTIDVRLDGEPARRWIRVRIAGIQAMEQTTYASDYRTGECHAVEATLRLDELVRRSKRRVRLAAVDPDRPSGRRWTRHVAVRIGRRWKDVGRILVREGRALWGPRFAESAWNRTYSTLSQRAAALGRGIFDTGHCAPGPDPVQVRLMVNWNADGDDRDDPNGEWVRLRNLDPSAPLVLDGWWLRDSTLRRFHFPPGSVVPPGGEATIYVGVGDTDPAEGEYYWGRSRPAFENVTHDGRARGDGAYLFDPHGDARAWMQYPCREDCADPNQGLLALEADPRGREHVTIRNGAAWPVALEGYVLRAGPYGYAFGGDVVLQPGEALRLDLQGTGEDERLRRHWGLDRRVLRDGGGVVTLRTFTDVRVACAAWGTRAC